VLGAARGQREHLMERMVHGTPCAVAVAPEGYAERAPRRLSRIGVGFADTPEGRAALALGGELARIAGCEERVIAGSGLSPGLASHAARSPALGLLEGELERETETALERVSEIPHAVRTTRELRRGDPRGALLEACTQLDLLVLGSRGYGPVRHALLGGVSADV
jgi:nucleotide-binding universal stress UspA family protein